MNVCIHSCPMYATVYPTGKHKMKEEESLEVAP